MSWRSFITLSAALIIPTLIATAAPAQSLQQRINNLRQQRAQQEAQRQQGIRQKLRAPLGAVNLQDVSAREAFQWVSQNGDIPIVINWQRMQQAGIDPQQPVKLSAERLSVRAALEMLTSQIAFEQKPVLEVTPWYVRVMSRDEANQNTVIRVYPIGDLTMRTPNFTNAPEFDLEQITQGSSGGGSGTSGGGTSGGLFDDAGRNNEDDDPFAQPGFNPATRIAELIRQTVEPDLWQANGGLHGSITVFGNNLVIRAPQYVHRRIGGDPRTTAGRPSAADASGARTGPAGAQAQPNRRTPRSRGAGIDRGPAQPSGERGSSSGRAGVEKPLPYRNRSRR